RIAGSGKALRSAHPALIAARRAPHPAPVPSDRSAHPGCPVSAARRSPVPPRVAPGPPPWTALRAPATLSRPPRQSPATTPATQYQATGGATCRWTGCRLEGSPRPDRLLQAPQAVAPPRTVQWGLIRVHSLLFSSAGSPFL